MASAVSAWLAPLGPMTFSGRIVAVANRSRDAFEFGKEDGEAVHATRQCSGRPAAGMEASCYIVSIASVVGLAGALIGISVAATRLLTQLGAARLVSRQAVH